MSAFTRSAELPAAAGERQWAAGWQQLWQMLVRAIDGLAPVRRCGEYRDLPPQWYEHPPY